MVVGYYIILTYLVLYTMLSTMGHVLMVKVDKRYDDIDSSSCIQRSPTSRAPRGQYVFGHAEVNGDMFSLQALYVKFQVSCI